MVRKRLENGFLVRLRRGGLPRMLLGIGLVGFGVLALAAPLATGVWSLQFLSLVPLVVGLSDLYTTAGSPADRARPAAYGSGILAVAVALILFLSPSLVINGVVALVLVFLAIDGAVRIGGALFAPDSAKPRTVAIINGASNLALALAGWWLWRTINVNVAIGVAIAGYSAMAGWRMLVSPVSAPEEPGAPEITDTHPDPKLGLGEQKLFGEVRARHTAAAPAIRQQQFYWLLAVGVVLFAIHLSRMQSADTWLGLISPFVATAGDVVMAVAFGALLILPLRLGWRRLTRPLERKAWTLRLSGHDADMDPVPRRLVQAWTDTRFAFSASLANARRSLPSAAGLAVGLGLPVAILFAAVNPIWGFNWYFNTESWASGFYQKITELRVDTWRASMVDAVAAAYGGRRDDLFQVTPAGIDDGDFSFIVIGDTGEGDGSQYSLVDRYLELGRRDDIRFLIISSDVIYPAGAMTDYENNFYLPFKGFTKPVYAIPGNHDWFDALEGFNANFLEPKAARAALSARAEADLHVTSTDKDRIDRLLGWAERLRDLYRIQIGRQRGPFFEIQTRDFAILAIDTGILRTVDDRQRAWIAAALERARGKFTLAIVGHPKYAGGMDTSKGDADFAALYAMLARAGVPVMMAGDTHAFEYYLEKSGANGNRRAVHHFVNGGGGAYLSLGGALAWPAAPPTRDWAYYPGSDAVRTKLDAETPVWKQPFWQWIRHFGAWPLSIETLSSMFDFNRAPFYQSFMEVRVERSRRRVVFALHGVNGPVRWGDLDMAPDLANAKADDPVEFIVEMTAPKG